jgi:hypothetical protein
MTDKKLILVNLVLISIICCVVFFSAPQTQVLEDGNLEGSAKGKEILTFLTNSDSIFVIHFHPTVQCSCCINVGSFARKGLEQFYAKPYDDSLVIFKEYNIDEDSSTAKRYGIFWSALGFEKFREGGKEFKEIESVWEFCEEKENFFSNFKRELDEFIVGPRKAESELQNKKKDTVKITDEKPGNKYPQEKRDGGGKN